MNTNLKGQSGHALNEPHNSKEEQVCANTDSQPGVAEASGAAVSPAVSRAISPDTGENYKTESVGNKPRNQSGSQSRDRKPNCYACKHRRSLTFDAHSRCTHPRIGETDAIVTPLLVMHGAASGAMKRLNITLDPHGVKNGWAMWPLNFDPVWLESCDGFEAKS